ncbi:MAG: hypothetical protein ACYC96_04695 [Fimbriimonadaceae bacterium]
MMFSQVIAAALLLSRAVAPILPWETGPAQLFHPSTDVASAASRVVAPATTLALAGARQAHPPPSTFTPPVITTSLSQQEIQEIIHPTPPKPGSSEDEWARSNFARAAELSNTTRAWKAAVASGDDRAAEAGLASCLAKYPDEPAIALLLSELLVKRGDWAHAASLLTDPESDLPCGGCSIDQCRPFLKAAVLAHLGYVFAGERASLRQYLGPHPSLFAHFATGSAQDMEAMAWLIGGGMLQVSYPERALAYVQRAAAVYPGDPEVLVSLGACLNGLGLYGQAEALLRPYLGKFNANEARAIGWQYAIARRKSVRAAP